MVFIAEGIPCGNILKPYRSGDITGVGTFDFLAVVRMHLEDTAYTFLLSFCGIQDVSSLLHDPGVYTEECQLPTNGSAMILNARAAIGASSLDSRVISSPVFGSVPLTAGTSVGAGR